MANTTVHGTLIKYEKSGTTVNQTTIYPKTAASDVSLTKQGNVPSSATTVQALAAALGTLAFKSSIANTQVSGLTTSQFASGVITTALNITAEGKIADARALKTLSDKITTNTNNIAKLNSKSILKTIYSSDWSGSNPAIANVYIPPAAGSVTVNDQMDVDICANPTATNTELQAMINACMCGGQVNGNSKTVTIKAFGEVPSIDLPMVFIFHETI